jgi:hypothetical protein
MHYNLLFSGCSFTYGSELQGLENDLEHLKKHRFSHLVANHFGMTYDNISRGGACNDWIVDSTVEWFESGNTCDVAIIQFSKKSRLISYDENEKATSILPNFHATQVFMDKENKFSQYNEKIAAIYKHLYTDYYGTQNYYKNLFFINQYLNNKNVKSVFLSLSDESRNPLKRKQYELFCQNVKIQHIISGIIPPKEKDPSFYCKDYNVCLSTKSNGPLFLFGRHPSEIGHQSIANYIIENVNQLD